MHGIVEILANSRKTFKTLPSSFYNNLIQKNLIDLQDSLQHTHKRVCGVIIFFDLSENSKKGSSSSGDKDGSEKSSSHHSSGSLPPVAMDTTNKDGEDEGWCIVHVLCCWVF